MHFYRILLLFCAFFIGLFSYSQQVPLTFRVDMSLETVGANGVHVAGNFQQSAGYPADWNPATTELLDADFDEIYELTVMVSPGTYLYKFINGNSWIDPNEAPVGCGVQDGGGNVNRQLTIGQNGLSLPPVQFDSCNAVIHFSVNMGDEPISPEGVFVHGDFMELAGLGENWNGTGVEMTDLNGDGSYSLSLSIIAGTYAYLFSNGAVLESPPEACLGLAENGNMARIISATTADNAPPTPCFDSCELCDPALSTDYETYWWNEAVFYEIFVRSFYDSDGDGIGDFQGIIEKLDYLNDGDPETDDDLGITGIWLMPMMTSPSYHGYDVTDYYSVEPDYGTMADFQAFLYAAHTRGIKVIIDFVMNHSSSQHPWFQQSVNSQNGYRDWYVWSDNNPGNTGPWGQNVWHSTNGDFYYGLFWGGMPDLNYTHPPVKEEMFDITEYWMNLGVDGFRLDAVKYLVEDGNTLADTPETFEVLEEFNMVYKGANPDAVTVGEAWSNTTFVAPYVQNDRLDLCFEFDLATSILNAVNTSNPALVTTQLQLMQSTYPKLQYATFLTNHDIDRVYGLLGNDPVKMKQSAALYLTLPGVPFIYYGEEIGMLGSGADENKRRPMQWAAGANAGFSTSSPWIAPGANVATNNVEIEMGEPQSILNHYKKLVHFRNDFEPLRKGYTLPLAANNENLLGYIRIYEGRAVAVVSNFGEEGILPVLGLASSTLPQEILEVNELFSGAALTGLGVNAQGGFSGWAPSPQALQPGETWVLAIGSNFPVSTPMREGVQTPMKLYPNPANETVIVSCPACDKHTSHYTIYDLKGALLQQGRFQGSSTQIDVHALPPGIYFIQLENAEVVALEKLVVE